MSTGNPFAAPPADDHGLFEVTLPGDGASSLGGVLAPGGFARLLMNLFAQERCGRLVVESGTPDMPGPRGTLYFLHGEPVHAICVDADARLLARLRAAGELAAEAAVDPTLPLVPLLVRKKWARATAIMNALRAEVRDFVDGALAAEIGVYRFFDDVELAQYVPLVGVNPFDVIMDRMSRAQPADELRRRGDALAPKFPVPCAGFANAAARLSAFAGGVDIEPVVDGTTSAKQIYDFTGLGALHGGLLIQALVDTGLVRLIDEAAPAALHDRRRASQTGLPICMPTESLSLAGAALPGGVEILSLYLLLKPERDDDVILGVAKDASLLEVERAFRARLQELDPARVPRGAARPHLLARLEELRAKVERAYQARVSATPGERITSYDLDFKIGSGETADVFAGRSVDDPDQLVAIKKLRTKNDKDARGFLREARLARRIAHRNVVRVLSVGKAGEDLFIAMELVDGADLARITRDKKMPVEVACRIVADVCGGLHAAHTAHDAFGNIAPILHRDISPQNILVGKNGVSKLSDFGVAKALGSNTETLEQSRMVLGKVSYLAPELVDGMPASVRSDVYAMGMVLWGCLAELPYAKGDLMTAMRAITNDPLPTFSKAGGVDVLDKIIARATARNPEERYSSAQAFQLALEELLTRLPPPDVAAWVQEVCAQGDTSKTAPAIERAMATRVPIIEEPA